MANPPEKIDRPSVLDVVDRQTDGMEYQISHITVRPGDPLVDYGLNDTFIEDRSVTVYEAGFKRYSPSLDPRGPHILHREEGVRKTGILRGGYE